MFFRFILLLLGVFLVMGTPHSSLAEDSNAPSDGTLHVLRPSIHADQDIPEMCLEFDHFLAINQRIRIGSDLRLESEGTGASLSAKDVSIADADLCVPVQHRKSYRLTLTTLRGVHDEALASPYHLSFTVPARQPSLVFVNRDQNNGVMQWQEVDPVLRGINVQKAKIELFRITDPAQQVAAWVQRQQVTLAPSETATFAHTNGTLVWQGNVGFKVRPDQVVEQSVHEDVQNGEKPGLYLMVASAPQLREKETDLAPIAAVWLLRSDLHLTALLDGPHLLANVRKTDLSGFVRTAHITVVDAGGKVLAEGQTGDDGSLRLDLSEDQRAKMAMLIAKSETGAVDFMELSAIDADSWKAAPVMARLEPNAAFYMPGASVEMTLSVQDLRGQPVALKGSSLDIIRGKEDYYATLAVPDTDRNGTAHVAFTAPVGNGLWNLVWRRSDGTTLAQTNIRITTSLEAPKVTLTADRAFLLGDGDVNLTVKSAKDNGQPAPYVAGHVWVHFGALSNVFPTYQDFHFGFDTKDETVPFQAAYFLTDDKGLAHLHLHLTIPQSEGPAREVVFSSVSDPSSGALDQADLIVPLKPSRFIVGVRPFVSDSHYAENSLARFDVVTLGSGGKVAPADDLKYQIYEEGRGFDWYQADGHWQYRLDQKRRRLGGGTLAVGADGLSHIEWPVAAGSYLLEITDADGLRLVSHEFSAGWGENNTEPLSFVPLDFKLMPSATGGERRLFLRLPQPALVTIILADDHIRKISHLALPQGDNDIPLLLQSDWGRRLRVTALADVKSPNGPLKTMKGTLDFETASGSSSNAPSPSGAVEKSGASSPTVPVVFQDRHQLLRSIGEHAIVGQHVWRAPAGKGASVLAIISPDHLYLLPQVLSSLLEKKSLTSTEIVQKLSVFYRWQHLITGTRMVNGLSFLRRQDELLLRLLSRQQPDGGFANFVGGASDLAVTAEVVQELAGLQLPQVQFPLDRAQDWLKHRLENTWFDEVERPARAVAYAAMAQTGKVDVAGLHYFADQSRDKTLPPRGRAELALAFTKIKDRDNANFWLKQLHPEDLRSMAVLAILSSNEFFNFDDEVRAVLQHPSGMEGSITNEAGYSMAIWNLQNKLTGLKAEIASASHEIEGVMVVGATEKTGLPAVRNVTNQLLYLTEVETYASPVVHPSIVRHIYDMSGGEILRSLQKGQVYVVTLEGNWDEGSPSQSLGVYDDVGPALTPITCALEGAGKDGFLLWLPAFSTVQSCEQTMGALDVLLVRSPSEMTWYMAYLARATMPGTFELNPPIARSSDARETFEAAGSDWHLKIRP